MVHNLIDWSLKNRYLVLLISTALFIWGIFSVRENPVDAIPDLSENQVIVFTEWMGRGPQLIEDQVTYPLVTNLQGLPGIKYVRASSMFGMSFIYLIFEDDTDTYWARQRVLERLSTVSATLPQGVTPTLGPDGTGVGHILWYTLDAPKIDLGEQRAIQDWYVKFALQNVPGVSEIASFGGFSKQYEIRLDQSKLSYYKISVGEVINAIRSNNNESGGRKFELSDIGYIIKTSGYLESIDQISDIPVRTSQGVALSISHLASVQATGESRLGIFDQDGQGERVGGIVVMRYNENAAEVIDRVKKKMNEISGGLPDGVKFDIIYDRGELIRESISSIKRTLIEESGIVAAVNTIEGQYVDEGSTILTIEGYSSLWVEADARSAELNGIKTGDRLPIVISGYESIPAIMTVSFIEPEFRSGSRYITLRGVFRNPDNLLKPGMQVTIRLPGKADTGRLRIPANAVIHSEKSSHVWVETAEGIFEPRTVRTGEQDAGQAEILEGLEAGEKLVVQGAYLLYSEYVLKKGDLAEAL